MFYDAILFSQYTYICISCSGSYCKLMSLWKSINIDKEDMIEEYLKYMSATEGEEHADTSHIAHLWQQLGVFLRTIQDYQRVL